MGPKKKAGGEGKKLGKTSKLAKMNEQERAKYLEKKMAEEEEVKRRKEEMVTVFLKLKLNQEERKGHLNSCKLIENWRNIRRDSKTKELKNDVIVLKETFDRALQKKNRHIELLMQDLDEAEEQYSMAFRSQIDTISYMTEVHNQRLNDLVNLHEEEREKTLKRSEAERETADTEQTRAETYLDDVIISLDQRHNSVEQEIRNEYQSVKDDIRNKNLEERQALQLYLEETMDTMWRKLQNQVNDFKSNTEEKRRMYNELLAKDKKGVGEIAENNIKIIKLMEKVAKLKEILVDLGDSEEKRLSGLRIEKDDLTNELHDTRRAVSVQYRNKEEMKLRKLAVQTDSFEKLVDEVFVHQDQMARLADRCLRFEEDDGYAGFQAEMVSDLTDDEKSCLRRIDRSLRQDYAKFQNLDLILRKTNGGLVDRAILKRNHRQLNEENLELKELLRHYIQSLSASRELSEAGLNSVRRQVLRKAEVGKMRPRPKSCFSSFERSR